jgi:hypothetical protein
MGMETDKGEFGDMDWSISGVFKLEVMFPDFG